MEINELKIKSRSWIKYLCFDRLEFGAFHFLCFLSMKEYLFLHISFKKLRTNICGLFWLEKFFFFLINKSLLDATNLQITGIF